MEKGITLFLAALLIVSLLSGCGNTAPVDTATSVDLAAFYDELAAAYELPMMTDAEGDALESYYPGLGELEANQRVVKLAAMTGAVAEVALIECNSAADAAKAAEIFTARIAAQVDGGAWYPDSIEGWKKASVITKGNYAALIALGDNTAAAAESFNAKF